MDWLEENLLNFDWTNWDVVKRVSFLNAAWMKCNWWTIHKYSLDHGIIDYTVSMTFNRIMSYFDSDCHMFKRCSWNDDIWYEVGFKTPFYEDISYELFIGIDMLNRGENVNWQKQGF